MVQKRVFISYHTQEPDKSLAQEFYDHLEDAGHEPFMAAKSIKVGETWAERIDEELKSCDYFLLLLSEQSASSGMVLGEVRTAKSLQDDLGKPIILPIRLNLPFDDPLNYELRSILQTIQHAFWKSPKDTLNLIQEILDLIAAEGAPKIVIPPKPKPYPKNRPPLPVADLELPRGTMTLDSQFYIKREPWDSRCLQEIENRAGLVRIKAPRQMGKTSLLARIRDRAADLGYRTVTLDFSETDEKAFTDLSIFLQRFCVFVSRKLGISRQKVIEFWDEKLFGPKENCSDYFEEYILSKINVPLFLGLDELERLFNYKKISQEFLMLLRSWNEKGRVNETWGKLRIAIAHSTESYVVLDINSSPFNVGLAVDLSEFTSAQVLDLAQMHGLSWGTEEFEALMGIVGGHPYLIRLALYHITNKDLTLAKLLAEAATNAGIYGEYLRLYLLNLKQQPDLAKAFERVVSSDNPVFLEPMLAFRLEGMGLVNLQGNGAVLRYESLYRPYFRSQLRIK